jgi:protein-S-isoprenylcysteine O-methyltransferase Ste14
MGDILSRWRFNQLHARMVEVPRFAAGRHKVCRAAHFAPMPNFVYLYLPVIATLLVFAERMREVATKRQVVAGKRKETLTFNLFMLCGLLIVAGGISEYFLRHQVLWWTTFIPGLILSLGSFALRRAAIRALGRFWSLHVEMREGHEFVRTGPFAFARHPVYLSMVFELLGIGLMLNAWITLIGVFLLFIPTVIARIRMEEEALVEQFGEAYRAYMQEVPAVIPLLRQKKPNS